MPTDPKDIKIVCTDVDGTLITPEVIVTPRIREAIRKLKEKGIIVAVCTGKSKGPWVKNVADGFGGKMPGVYINGTSVEDEHGNYLYEKCISEEALKICFDFATEHGLTIVPYWRRETYALEYNEFTEFISGHLLEPKPTIIKTLYELIGKVPVQKCCFVGTIELAEKHRPALESALKGKAVLTCAVDNVLEILPHGANKGNGVQIYLDHLGIDYKYALAIGDGENDFEMLQKAGYAVAMGNAKQKLKNIANFISKSNTEDGWAIAMEEVLLKEDPVPA